MTDYAGILVHQYDTTRFSRVVPVPAPLTGALVPITVASAGTWAAGHGARIAAGTGNVAARKALEMTAGKDWFDRVHLIPRSRVDFGNVVTTVKEYFELHNAHRTSIQITTITPNAGAGVDVFNPPSLPATLAAFTSLLDGSSTRLHPVLPQAEALATGAPIFDGSIDFTLDTGEAPHLYVRGFRIVFFPAEPETPFTEHLSFKTDVLPHVDGTEQRLALRAFWRQLYDFQYLLDESDRRRLQELLYTYRAKELALPLWHERTLATAQAIIGATSITVASTTDVDFRVGGLAVVYESPTKYDVVQVSAVTSTSISFTASPLLFTYDPAQAQVQVIPVRTAYIARTPSAARYLNNLEAFQVSFQVLDNTTGMPTGSTAGWNTYNGKVLLDDENVVGGDTAPESFNQKVYQIDNQTGLFFQDSRQDVSRRGFQKGFFCGNRTDVFTLRRLLLALAGKQKSFYMPTLIEDLLPVVDLTAASATMTIENVGYTRFAQSRAGRSIIRTTFTDGTSLVRTILSSVEVDNSSETLTLDSTWPANRTVDEVDRVEFYELVRFDTDDFQIIYEHAFQARMVAPVVYTNT